MQAHDSEIVHEYDTETGSQCVKLARKAYGMTSTTNLHVS